AVDDEADRAVLPVLAEQHHRAGEVPVPQLRHGEEQGGRERAVLGHDRIVPARSWLVKPHLCRGSGRECAPAPRDAPTWADGRVRAAPPGAPPAWLAPGTVPS